MALKTKGEGDSMSSSRSAAAKKAWVTRRGGTWAKTGMNALGALAKEAAGIGKRPARPKVGGAALRDILAAERQTVLGLRRFR